MADQKIIVSPYDLTRIEDKVDKMAEAVQKLVLVEERQSAHADRILKLEARADESLGAWNVLARRIDRWMNIGIGIWTVILLLITGKDLMHNTLQFLSKVAL